MNTKHKTNNDDHDVDVLCINIADVALSKCLINKSDIRMQIWDFMEKKNFVKDHPRPCHYKIPNFKRCGIAADKLSKMRAFRHAKCIKINPSMAQMHLRFLTLKHGKTLLVPSPALCDEFMYEIKSDRFEHFWQIKRASSKAGAKELGKIFNLDKKTKIDLYVVASVACSSNGVRLGKGLGYAEIEWAILYMNGCVTEETIVVTTVHDCQVLSEKELPTSILSKHDLPVDIIVTPTRIINVRRKLGKPCEGIYWNMITEEQLNDIPILRILKQETLKVDNELSKTP